MTALLGWLLQGVELIGSYALWAVETGWNSLMDAISAAVAVIFAALPSMSDAPSLGAPDWLQWANWFFPIGAILSTITSLLVMFVAWLAVRYVLRLVRAV